MSSTTTTILVSYKHKTPPAHPPDASGSAPRITPTRRAREAPAKACPQKVLNSGLKNPIFCRRLSLKNPKSDKDPTFDGIKNAIFPWRELHGPSTRATQLAGEVRGIVEALPKGAKGALILTGGGDFCETEDCKIRFLKTYNILGIERELAGLAYKYLGNVDVRPHELLSASEGSKEDRSEFHDGILKTTPDSTLVGLFRDFLPEHQKRHQISASKLRDVLSPTTFVDGNRAIHDITFQDTFFFLRSLRTSYVDDDAERADVWETVIAAVTDTPYGEAWQDDEFQLKAAAERTRSTRLKKSPVDNKKERRSQQFYSRAKNFEDRRKIEARQTAVTGLKAAGYIPGGKLQKLRDEVRATNDAVERLERTVDRLFWFVGAFPLLGFAAYALSKPTRV
ncbi:hypothetical protein C8R47DRAFT_1082500 [Mycena vitilis]|nr:hypothetical protein C8R47DRAFT_1082500 [Mycena vitilis]